MMNKTAEHPSMKTRLLCAMLCYTVLAVLAGLTLKDFPQAPFRTAVWVLIGALALKTWIATSRTQ